ncbi:hypothetical protein BJ912DRAFT_970602 [Pholiota molesta]|nr:hypothetical protein BJ912DRAFT_970602 [Pholiota molesta]
MAATQPRRSTRLAQRVNSLQPSRENSSDKKTISLPSSNGVMLPTNKENSAPDPPTQPQKKKVALPGNSKPKPKRVKMLGKLSGLLALPLDIFFEITSHLHPLDLLHLSRASRHFARMFLRTGNRHAWLAARRTVEGLPDCPSDISEARYAHLLFESVCSVRTSVFLHFSIRSVYVGLRGIGRRLLFNLRVRFCASCYKTKVEAHKMVEGVHGSLAKVLQIIPHNYSVTDLRVVEFFQDQFNTIKNEFMKACDDGTGDDFLKEKQAAVLAIIDHGELVSAFLEELQERKELERMRLRVIRKLQIDARIMELGYTRDEIPEEYAAYEEEIKKPKALTDRAWQGMAARMGALAAARRADAVRERIVARFWEWARVYGAQYSRDEWPDPFNAAKTDTVIRLLAEADASVPFTIARFAAHSAQIRADLVAWRDKANQEIVDKLAAVYGLPRSAATSSLDRASAVIHCVECAQLLFASGVMRHLHVCSRQRVLWAERRWDYDAGLHRIARALLHHAGLACDVSNEHVNDLQGDLRCKCSHMGFLALVKHLWQGSWSCDETFKLYKLGGGPLGIDNVQHAAKNKDGLSMAGAVVLVEMTLPLSSTSLHPQIAKGPLKDADPCCRLCGEASYMQVDMRSMPQAVQHMQDKHGQVGAGEADLCPARDVLRAAREYAAAHGAKVIVTRMGGR